MTLTSKFSCKAIIALAVLCLASHAQNTTVAQNPSAAQNSVAGQSIGPQTGPGQQQMGRGDFPTLIAPTASATDNTKEEPKGGFSGPLITTISSLVVVLAIFGGLVWISRHYGGASTPNGALPKDVLQHLGSSALDAKTKVTFLKCGNRILVVGQTQNGDPHTLTEITETDEVERITNRCMGRPEIIGRRSELGSQLSSGPHLSDSGTQHARVDYAAR